MIKKDKGLNMDKSFLNEYSLRQLSIFELRTMARNIGVVSPTTQKKDELVNKILNITSGKEKPEMPKSRQGRPPKKIIDNNINKINSFDKTNYIDDLKYNFDVDSDRFDGILNSPENIVDYVNYSDIDMTKTIETGSGYYAVMKDGSSFVFEKGNVSNALTAVFVSKENSLKYHLKPGDYIKFVYEKTSNTRFLLEVKEKNNKIFDADNFVKDFEDFKIINQFSDDFLCDNIQFGKRYIVNKNKIYNVQNEINNLNFELKNIKVVNLMLDVLPECVENVLNNKFENFYTNIGQSAKQNNFTIGLAVDRAKRLVETGNNVVLIVNSIEKLIKFKNFEEGYLIKELKDKSFDNCYKVLTLARSLEKGSITVICQFNNNQDEYSKNVLDELTNFEIKEIN